MAETITLKKSPVKVTYKKSRNPRAFRTWEQENLTLAMINCSEVKSRLEEISANENVSLDDMKPTVLPSKLLYLIVNCYTEAYKRLMNESLIKTGNVRSNPNLH